jgi:hypothetical protein
MAQLLRVLKMLKKKFSEKYVDFLCAVVYYQVVSCVQLCIIMSDSHVQLCSIMLVSNVPLYSIMLDSCIPLCNIRRNSFLRFGSEPEVITNDY